jgi:outer membrane protein OmpA-like peptidoglycan-associated protein
MSDEPDSWRDTSNQGGVAGKHPTADAFAAKVAPTFGDELNTIKDPLVFVACWRLDDIRFEFASSFIRPEATDEFSQLASLRAAHPDAPVSIFGHADPVAMTSSISS